MDVIVEKTGGSPINQEINGEIGGIGDRLVVHPEDG